MEPPLERLAPKRIRIAVHQRHVIGVPVGDRIPSVDFVHGGELDGQEWQYMSCRVRAGVVVGAETAPREYDGQTNFLCAKERQNGAVHRWLPFKNLSLRKLIILKALRHYSDLRSHWTQMPSRPAQCVKGAKSKSTRD